MRREPRTAMFAAALAACAAAGASAEEKRSYTGGRFYLDIGAHPGFLGRAEGGDGHQQRIEIESWSWGAAQAGASLALDAPAAGRALPDSAVLGRGAPIDPVIPVPVVVAPRDIASGQASGKRQHGSITITPQLGARAALPLLRPLPSGSVRVKLRNPWLGCRVGASITALTLTVRDGSYRLEDAVTTGCAPDSASFDYAKVTVRGWDPATKQE